jgi:Nif-specific regulatory protein
MRSLLVITAVLGFRQEQRRQLEQILDVLHREFALVRGTIMLLSPDGSELRVEALHGVSPDPESPTYRRGEGITGQVLETSQPAIIEDIASEPDFTDRIHQRRASADSRIAFICVPIIDGERRCIGTLAVDRPPTCDIPLEDVQSILVIVASLIANHMHILRENQVQQAMLAEENLRLRAALGERFAPQNMVGRSGPMRGVYR